jgi:hypothetical protein
MKLSKAELERRLFGSSRDICINWRGAPLRTGDNLLFQAAHHTFPMVGQLIDLSNQDSIPSSEKQFIATKGSKSGSRMALVRLRRFVEEKHAPRPSAAECFHLPYGMKEVAETLLLEWIPVEAISNICFIFHIDLIQKGLVSCGGMERVFFIRFQESNGKFVPIKERSFSSFYRDPQFPFQESFPEAIWCQLAGLKQQLAKEMSCGGVWDGRTKSAKMNGVPPSFFGYLKYEMEEDAEMELQYDRIRSSRPRKHLFDNFSICNVHMNSTVHQIRVLDEWELDIVRKVCGNSFAVGITVPVPSMKQVRALALPMNGTVWLRKDHEVRIVTCVPHEADIDLRKGKRACPSGSQSAVNARPKKLRCSYRGLDLRHVQSKMGTWEMIVQARFSKVLGNSHAVIKAQSAVLTAAVVSDVESEELEVRVGVYIRIGIPPNLETYVVDSIDNGLIHCKDPTDDDADVVVLSIEEANELYNRYIRY